MMKGHRTWSSAWLVLLFLAGSSGGGVWALTDEEIFRDFRFNFVNPGARALGMGGAFIAAGDDATAAQSNPAALTYLSQKEIFVEYRQIRPEIQGFNESIGNTDPNEPNKRPFLDAQTINNREDSSDLSFVSFVYPFELARRRVAVAVSRQTVLDVQNSLAEGGAQTTFRFALGNEFPVWASENADPNCEMLEQQTEVYSVCNTATGGLDKAELVHYNLGFLYGVSQDFAVGVTLTYATLDMKAHLLNSSVDPLGILKSENPRDEDPSGFEDLKTKSSVDDSDNAFTYTVGLLWHPDSVFPNKRRVSPIRFGLVYRKGADLAVDETTEEYDTINEKWLVTEQFRNRLRVPDRFGLGVSYEPSNHWTIALDVERIQYSDLLKDYKKGANFFTSPALPKGQTLDIDPKDLEFDVDDATVVHVGVEFSISQNDWSQAIRAGYFNAPDNRIRLVSIDSGDKKVDKLYKDVFSGADDENHLTAGFSIGTPFKVHLQVGADFSKTSSEFVVSAIYRFGKTI